MRVYRLFQKPRISRCLETKANQLQTIPHLHVSRECGRETIFDSMNTPQLLSLCFVMPGDRPDEFNWFASRYVLCCVRQTVIFLQVAEGSNFRVLDTTGNCLFSTNNGPQLLSQALLDRVDHLVLDRGCQYVDAESGTSSSKINVWHPQ